MDGGRDDSLQSISVKLDGRNYSYWSYGLRGSILHRSPLLSVDSVVSELLADEIRLKSQTGKGILLIPTQSVLAVPSRPHASYENKPYLRVGFDECSFCKQKGH
ncbi:hypothetical protein ACOSP7_032362 [Xanthoceras sorbifolium]